MEEQKAQGNFEKMSKEFIDAYHKLKSEKYSLKKPNREILHVDEKDNKEKANSI